LYIPQLHYYKQKPVPGWEPNVPRDAKIYIKPENETWLIGGKECCEEERKVLVMVCSAPSNFLARKAVRNTWGSFNSTKYKLKFLLGVPLNTSIQEKIDQENTEYGDIVQENFIDTYNNLTLKSIMMFKWYIRCCPKSDYLLKSDDDMFINVTKLNDLLQKSPKVDFLVGNLICRSKPHTNEHSKWYTPKYMYPYPYFPNYLSGTAYLMSRDVAEKLYKVSLTVPLLHLEDVFITGICAVKARVRPRNNKGFTYYHIGRDCRAHMITNHHFTPSQMYEAWKDRGPSDNCSLPVAKLTRKASLSRVYTCS